MKISLNISTKTKILVHRLSTLMRASENEKVSIDGVKDLVRLIWLANNSPNPKIIEVNRQLKIALDSSSLRPQLLKYGLQLTSTPGHIEDEAETPKDAELIKRKVQEVLERNSLKRNTASPNF